ncbi:hypothetical protein EYF80_036419 [Liparis tanakae]|uniref:Uncharacterized protein n=1 Tax=Liparis tanakae TaxID=230148 RepID=A0A4Z2GKY3_9TELE|nr:hypothetical protein EYF80_036419 [Liparis tanakae]
MIWSSQASCCCGFAFSHFTAALYTCVSEWILSSLEDNNTKDPSGSQSAFDALLTGRLSLGFGFGCLAWSCTISPGAIAGYSEVSFSFLIGQALVPLPEGDQEGRTSKDSVPEHVVTWTQNDAPALSAVKRGVTSYLRPQVSATAVGLARASGSVAAVGSVARTSSCSGATVVISTGNTTWSFLKVFPVHSSKQSVRCGADTLWDLGLSNASFSEQPTAPAASRRGQKRPNDSSTLNDLDIVSSVSKDIHVLS